jgi:hypothetical protein
VGAERYYRLWSSGNWFDHIIEPEEAYKPTVRALYPTDWSGEGTEVLTDIELVPQADGPQGAGSIATRLAGQTIGFLNQEDASAWAGVVRRVIASGFVPVTRGRIYAREYEAFDGPEFWANIQVALGEPGEALPMNEPPAVPHVLLPKSSVLQVTKEDQHVDSLLKILPTGGRGVFYATLHEMSPVGRGKPTVEVRINDECVGQLTPQTSQRFLPLIAHLQSRGLLAACWSDVTGSTLAAEVRVNAVKANEASADVLDGPPADAQHLVPELSDPMQYDLTGALSHLKSLDPVPAPSSPVLSEPPDSAVIRFTLGRRYQYVAVRKGSMWWTTASSDGEKMKQLMFWHQLGPLLKGFDYATEMDWVNPTGDSRLRQQGVVMCYMVGDAYTAAINIASDADWDGDWYTTIGDQETTNEILRDAIQPRVVTSWTRYGRT